MKSSFKWVILIGLLIISSCAREQFDFDAFSKLSGVYGCIMPIEEDSVLDTKASIEPDNQWKYSFTQGDRINIWSDAGTLLIYKATSVAESGHAVFEGAGFTLTEGMTYYSSYPTIRSVLDDYNALSVTFEGQTQSANNDASHLAEYAYVYSSAQCVNGNTSFSYHHFCSFLRFVVTLPKALTIKELTITADSDVFVKNGTVDISAGTLTPASGEMTDTMTLSLDDVVVSDKVLKAFMVVAPYNAGSFVVRVKDSEDKVYTSPVITKNALAAGKAAKFAVEVFEGTESGVAKIGDTAYPSLAEAVAAAQAGDVITLIADDDISLTASSSEIEINKPLTITGEVDANGVPLHTVYGCSDGTYQYNDLFLNSSTGTVTVSNIKIAGFGDQASSRMGRAPVFIGSANNNAVIENVYISALNCEGIHINGGTFTIRDCSIDCEKADGYTKGICVVNDATGSIIGTTITGVDNFDMTDDTTAGIELQGSGAITISGCTVESGTIGISATPVWESYDSGPVLQPGTSQVSISDCFVKGVIYSVACEGIYGALMSIISGTYDGLLYAGENDNGLSISGGIFNDDVIQEFCAAGYAPAENTDPATSDDYPCTVQPE